MCVVIGRANSLHDAREIARKNEGSESIRHEKDGTYTVEKLPEVSKNEVKQKPGSQFDASVVEFSINNNGTEEIITNQNASLTNKGISNLTTIKEKTGQFIDNAETTIKSGVQKVESEAKAEYQAVKTGIKNLGEKFTTFVHDNFEFMSPVTSFIRNPFSQRVPALPSSDSNCGPTSGAIILDTFLPGFLKDGKNPVQMVRDASGGPVKGALTEQQIINGVEKVSKGKVTGRVVNTQYRSSDSKKLLTDITNEIKKGNLLVMCTGFSVRENGSRHYVAIVGVDKKGNLLISDPYKTEVGTKPDVWTVDKLQERMNRTNIERNHNTSLISFSKKK